jgi:HAE1 family hydrophobic/amphiphilic exporter-1
MVRVKAPLGTPLERTRAITEAVRSAIACRPWFDYAAVTIGSDQLKRVNEGSLYVKMLPRARRQVGQMAAMEETRRLVAGISGARIAVEVVPRVAGGGLKWADVQLELRGSDLAALERAAAAIAAGLRAQGGYADVDLSAEGGRPELSVAIDRARAAELGVSAATVGDTVRWLIGGERVASWRVDGDRHDIRLRLESGQRATPAAVADLSVRSASGRLVPLRDVARVGEGSGPVQIERYNRARKVTVYANLAGGKVLGDAIPEIEALVAAAQLPPGHSHGFTGDAQMMAESFASLAVALGLAVVLVYMVLASQFESLWQPLVIMASLPFALVGAIGLLVITGMTLSIFTFIGVIMLFGIVTKNAILLVDKANALRESGVARDEALAQAGLIRLRPILMTTLAMIAGMLPVAIGGGDGSETRAPMAIAVIGGLVVSTLLTLVVVPAFYSLADAAIARWRRQ